MSSYRVTETPDSIVLKRAIASLAGGDVQAIRGIQQRYEQGHKATVKSIQGLIEEQRQKIEGTAKPKKIKVRLTVPKKPRNKR